MLNYSLKLIIYKPPRDINPQTHHVMRHNPTEPVFLSTPFGDTKIPEPEKKVTFSFTQFEYKGLMIILTLSLLALFELVLHRLRPG